MRWQAWITRYGTSFSFVGLAFGAVFFAASLTPSLLPRTYATQGALSGFALAVGYGVGVLTVLLWLYLELPPPPDRLDRLSRWRTPGGRDTAASPPKWTWPGSLDSRLTSETRAAILEVLTNST